MMEGLSRLIECQLGWNDCRHLSVVYAGRGDCWFYTVREIRERIMYF